MSSYILQDGLKRRMVQLKTRVEEATKAVAEERQRNVQLLNLIFPADVSRKLWLGNCLFTAYGAVLAQYLAIFTCMVNYSTMLLYRVAF